NWINGEVNFHFYYTGAEITYNLGELSFGVLGDFPTITGNVDLTAAGITDINSIKGYRLIGYGLYPAEYIWKANSANSLTLSRQTWENRAQYAFNTPDGTIYSGTSSGNYTISNYGADTVIASMSFAAGVTTLYTGTYDARQLPIGTLITGSGIAAGTYVRGVTSSGAIIISQATTEASDGDYTVTGYRSYSKSIGNLTYSGEIEVPQDFAYLNNYSGGQLNYSYGGTGKLVFTDPNAMFISANGAAADDSAFIVSGMLEFKGNATFATGYGVNLSYNTGAPTQGRARLNNANNTIQLNATVDVAGDFTKIGPDQMRQRGGATANIILHGGDFNLLDGTMWLEYAGYNMTASRLQGAGAVNIARPALTANANTYPFLYLNATEINTAQSGTVNLIDDSTDINLYTGAFGVQGSGTKPLNSQLVGDVYLKSGRNALGVITGGAATVESFPLILKSLNRENGATVSLFGIGTTFGGTTNIGRILVQNDASFINDLVGTSSGTDYGAKDIAILPWAGGHNSPNQGTGYNGNITDFVTYVSGSGADSGFRLLAADEYRVGWTGADGDNVRLDSALTMPGSTTINSLKVTAGNQTISGLLNITSGAVLAAGGFNFLGTGTISSGANPIIFNGGAQIGIESGNVILHNTVSGTDIGLIVATNAYSRASGEFGGTVLIEGGAQLQIIHSNFVTEANAVRIDAASRLLVDANSYVGSLAGTGYVLLNSANYRFSVGAAFTVTEAAGHVIVKEGGSIAPGDVDGPLQASALYFGKNITGVDFRDGSLLMLDLGASGISDMLAVYTAAGDSNRNISNPTLTLSNDAIIQFNFLDGFADAEVGSEWLLTSGFSDLTLGEVLLQNAGGDDLSDYFSLSVLNNNLLLTSLAIIPEPGTWALLLTGAALLLVLRRRR
ncbi:MAG: PEP-CTERM sorting domain-containing protein, partial [Verrucomicrobiales bacterium]|nr:PEP-CTERM sorting domain-containing protein [Verrucomicrobiales bacterium]